MYFIHIYRHRHTDRQTHTHIMEYYSAIKKNEILPFATTWMNLEGIMWSEISQTEKDKYCIYHLYRESKKIQQTSEYNKKAADSQI